MDDIDLDILFGDENSEPNFKVNVSSQKRKTEVTNNNKTVAATSFKEKGKKIFSRNEKEKIYNEILDEYGKMHPNISDRQFDEISEKIIKTVDPSIYLALSEYDKNTETTNKRLEYINIMLKNIRRKPGEPLKDYREREASERNRLLKKYDIEVNYNLEGLGNPLEKRNVTKYAREFSGKSRTFSLKEIFSPQKARHLSVKGFATKEESKKIIVPNKDEASAELTKIRKAATKSLDSSKKFVGGLLDKFKPSKEKIHITAPKGFFNKLKEKKEKNPEKFKRNSIRALIVAGIVSLSVTVGYLNFNGNTNNIEPTNYGSVITEDESEKSENDLDISIENEADTEESIENNENNSTNETQEDLESSYVSTTEFVSTLINSTNISFDTEFQMPNGTYYETPEGTGNYGNYTKFDESNLKLTYIDVMYEDGKIIQYDASSNLDVASIKKLHPEAKISYHVETTDGHILGWNPENSNNIESYLIKGHIEELKSYMNSEEIEYLKTIDFSQENSITKKDSNKIINIIQKAENTRQTNLELYR